MLTYQLYHHRQNYVNQIKDTNNSVETKKKRYNLLQDKLKGEKSESTENKYR